ncbi:hypothetical protein ES332_D11G045400v1 [Gossypium tomentosum]|uniref:Succinate dehydrogenase assembly factor 2, mitochondrial n=1 Tax=Gossypium tomentosum TaxID=34277 RepID=A0A5D2IJ74_GOSTO|nr:hypothetical protein ES332_D11G045400v1 [Gossypium tomentosum]
MLRRALLNAQRLVKSSAIANRTTTIIRPQYGWVSRFSSTNISNAQSLEMDLSTGESKRRLFNRLLYRSKQRGFLELDLVLGKWVEEHIYSMDENGIKALVHVLDLQNPDLWRWLTGQERPPEAVSGNPVRHELKHSCLSYDPMLPIWGFGSNSWSAMCERMG